MDGRLVQLSRISIRKRFIAPTTCETDSENSSRPRSDLHPWKYVYIGTMLATPELICETAQLSRLAELLPHWRQVPLYRDSLNRIAAHDLRAGFQQLPFLQKREMRADFPRNFLPTAHSLESLLANQPIELEHTSGTSEERLPVIFRRGWWDAQEQRALRLNRFVASVLDEHPRARRAAITPPACNGLTCPTAWMSREQRTIGKTLFVNLARIPFVLEEKDLARMATEITEWSPQFLDVDPVHGAWFALYCERHGIQFPSLKFTLCSYEFVSVVHRRILQRVFGVPVFNLYGSTETGHLLMENEGGEMKVSHDTAFLELVNEDSRGVGDLIVTAFSNDYMPLLRYRIGDLAERRARPYGTDFIIHGRARAAFTSANGQRVTTWDVDQCFAEAPGIAHYELRQEERADAILRFVPEGSGPSEKTLSRVVSQLSALLNTDREIQAQSMDVLLPSPSGKFRLTCPITPGSK
jgi:phenylacetate-CoA ligase